MSIVELDIFEIIFTNNSITQNQKISAFNDGIFL